MTERLLCLSRSTLCRTRVHCFIFRYTPPFYKERTGFKATRSTYRFYPDVYNVVSRAYERTSLIVTTNLPFENWIEVLGSERLTGALLDRLTHRVHILEANGESFRLRDARRRRRRSTKK